MDKTTSLLGALDAHKLPSTAQLDTFLAFVGEFLASSSASATSSAASKLSSSTSLVYEGDDRARVAIDRVGGIEGSGGVRFGDERVAAEGGLGGEGLSAVEADQIKQREAKRLSEGGERLAQDIRGVIEAYRRLLMNKNHDDILQESFFHFEAASSEADIKGSSVSVTSMAQDIVSQAFQTETPSTEKLDKDRRELQSAVSTILSTLHTSLTHSTSSLLSSGLSTLRLGLADALESLGEKAIGAGETVRQVEKEISGGERDMWGLPLDDEGQGVDVEKTWVEGMDTVRDAGRTTISTSTTVSSQVQERSQKGKEQVLGAWDNFVRDLRTDPQVRSATRTIMRIFRGRMKDLVESARSKAEQAKEAGKEAAMEVDESLQETRQQGKGLENLASFFGLQDPQGHLEQAIRGLGTFIGRFGSTGSEETSKALDKLIDELWNTAQYMIYDPELNAWLDDFFEVSEKVFAPGEEGETYARSEEGKNARRDIGRRWKELKNKEKEEWSSIRQRVLSAVEALQTSLEGDEDAKRVSDAQLKLGETLKSGVGAVNWQDIIRVYLPKILGKLKDVPIPRTEYKDEEMEFVLENLDVSSFDLLPSHIYIRNITDLDIDSERPSVTGDKFGEAVEMGALTHIKIQAMQMKLEDVSFWYRDKTAGTLAPSEFTGLLGLTMPPKGINVDLKIRLIPVSAPALLPTAFGRPITEREAKRHFNNIELASVEITDDVELTVKDTNHSILTTLFKPLVVSRLREALERTLSNQLRWILEWADGVAYDISKRKQVFVDAGMGEGEAFSSALWSELGRMRRESRTTGVTIGGVLKPTGTGIVAGLGVGSASGEKHYAQVAMGIEPQILAGSKRGPLGTASEPISMPESSVGGGRQRVEGFVSAIERKKKEEERVGGWRSRAFDL